MKSWLLAALALLCCSPAAPENCTVWRAEQLDEYLPNPSCRVLTLMKDLYLGDWLREPDPVAVIGAKIIHGGEAGHRTILDADFLSTAGPQAGDSSWWGYDISRFRTNDTHPPVMITFRNVHFLNLRIEQLDTTPMAPYLTIAFISCIVQGYFDHSNKWFYLRATFVYPVIQRNESESIFREGGAGLGDTHLHDRDIVLIYAFNGVPLMKDIATYIVARESVEVDEDVETGEDLAQTLNTFREPAIAAQAVIIPIKTRLIITDEICGEGHLTTSKNVSAITFRGASYVSGVLSQRPTLVFNNKHKCYFPDDVPVKFENLILEFCGESESLIPIVAKHQHQLILENVNIQFCPRGNSKTYIDALIHGDGNSRSNDCCPVPQGSLQKSGCSAMCDNICYANGTVMNLGACLRNVTSEVRKGSRGGIDAIHFVWICCLSLLISSALLVLVARLSRSTSQQCKKLQLTNKMKVKVYTKSLGKGASGEVFEATICDEGSKVYKPAAAKIIDLARIPGHVDEIEQYAVQEAEKLEECDHTNIVKCFGYCREELQTGIILVIVYERLPRTLGNLILSSEDFFEVCTYKQLLNIFWGIASGLSYMQSEWNMIHFDVKPENILLTEKMIPKIIDFGHVSQCSGESISITTRKGTTCYIAPEVELLGCAKSTKQRVNKSVDVFSLGVLMWECIMRRRIVHQQPTPICGVEPIVMHRVGEPIPVPWNGPPELKTLIQWCVRFDFDLFRKREDPTSETYDRPTIATVKRDLELMMNQPWANNRPSAWQSHEGIAVPVIAD